MPDSASNGHSSPLVLRPAEGERAARRLLSTDPVEPTPEGGDASAASPDATTDMRQPLTDVRDATTDVWESVTDARDATTDVSAFGGSGGGEPPTSAGGSGTYAPDPNTPRDEEMGLWAHLAELRARILYCVAAVGIAMIFTWSRSLAISEWFGHPIKQALKGRGTPVSMNPTGFFEIYLQVSLVSALILTMPFLLFQVWRFLEPALTNKERKYTLVLVPLSSALFFMGVGMGYLMTPMFLNFFLAFQPTGVAANWDYYTSMVLIAKTLLIFGIAFQVPVLTIFLNKTGIVSRNLLIQYWRHAVVVIFTLVAFVVPTWDPLTMTACALPPCLLYLLSIWIVKWL